MEKYTTLNTGYATSSTVDVGLRAHLNQVYATMSAGLLVTFLTAWWIGSSPALLSTFRNPETLEPNMLGWIVMFAPLLMIFGISSAVHKLSAAAVKSFFYIFSAIMGISIAWIFQAFTGVSIAQAFLVTAIAFGGLSLWGYTTKRDISGLGAFLIMGLIGLIVAMILNLFLGSPAISFAVNVIGVLIFSGLIAYDTQRIKTEYLEHATASNQEWLSKSATMGALSLYLNLINLMMMLLSFLGERD